MHFAFAFWWEMKKVSVFLFCAVAPLSFGQSVANLWNGSLNRYEQNFDTLPSATSGNLTFTPDQQIMDLGSTVGSSMSGWHLVTSTVGTGTTGRQLVASDGGIGTGNLYSHGASGSSDRALGSLTSATTARTARILRIRNNGSVSPGAGTIEFRWFFEQWRSGTGTTDVQFFDYSIQPASYALTATDGLAATATGIWTRNNLKIRVNGSTPVDWDQAGTYSDDLGSLPASHNVSSQAGFAPGSQDGNVFRSVRVGQMVNTTWAAGTDLLLRWTDSDVTGSDQGFAIDDVKVVPEPATMAMFAIGLGGFLRKRRK